MSRHFFIWKIFSPNENNSGFKIINKKGQSWHSRKKKNLIKNNKKVVLNTLLSPPLYPNTTPIFHFKKQDIKKEGQRIWRKTGENKKKIKKAASGQLRWWSLPLWNSSCFTTALSQMSGSEAGFFRRSSEIYAKKTKTHLRAKRLTKYEFPCR